MKEVAFISAGFEHCIAITADNRVIAWGNMNNISK
jgi:alpha-tubulin suppressor-like RCC1 family protein